MEIEWKNRGRIAQTAYADNIDIDDIDWDVTSSTVKDWWNRVFDACRAAKTQMIPGGKTILVTEEKNENRI